MPSPDLQQIPDLTLFDRDPYELVERAKAALLAKLPGFVWEAGRVETVLIEAMALQIAELVFAVNRLPTAIVQQLLALFEVEPDRGEEATVTVQFTLSDALGHTVPTGTRFRVQVGDDLVLFATTEDAVALPTETTADADAVALTVGSALNGLAAGTAVTVVDPIVFVDSAETVDTVTGGRDEEDLAAWAARATQRLARLNSTLQQPEHFTAYALEEPGVYRATTISMYDPDAVGDPGDHLGHVTVAVAGEDGALLSSGDKSDLEAAMEDIASVELDVHVIDPTFTEVDVTATVVREATHTDAEVEANVLAALEVYLSPDEWPWGSTVYRNELISLLDQVAGVARVTSITTPATDQALSGVAPLPTLGTVTVTVT